MNDKMTDKTVLNSIKVRQSSILSDKDQFC